MRRLVLQLVARLPTVPSCSGLPYMLQAGCEVIVGRRQNCPSGIKKYFGKRGHVEVLDLTLTDQ